MRTRAALVLLAVIAVVAAVWASLQPKAHTAPRLVPAWQLLAKDRYRGTAITDPFVSWSPDSRSLLVAGFSKIVNKDEVFRWNIGDRRLKLITYGTSPNYLDSDNFLYLVRRPNVIYMRSLSTAKQIEVLVALKRTEFWDDVTAFTYNPERKSVTLRLVEYTRHYLAGTEDYGLDGRRLPDPQTYLGEGVVERNCSPDGRWCALLRTVSETEFSLQIASKSRNQGRQIDSGRIGAVAWSPKGDVVAYAQNTTVKLVRPKDNARATIGVLGSPETRYDERSVSRLSWSPSGAYLAALVYVTSYMGDYPLIYVLDLSDFSMDG